MKVSLISNNSNQMNYIKLIELFNISNYMAINLININLLVNQSIESSIILFKTISDSITI